MKIKTIMNGENSTFSDASSDVLTIDSVRKAVEALKEASKFPFVVCIKNRDEWWKTIEKSCDVRNFALYGGIQVIKDEEIPEGVARFMMSDGTYKDIEITNQPCNPAP